MEALRLPICRRWYFLTQPRLWYRCRDIVAWVVCPLDGVVPQVEPDHGYYGETGTSAVTMYDPPRVPEVTG